MNDVVQYIFLFLIGTTILNFTIAVAARMKTANREFNILILYWVTLLLTYGGVAALSRTHTEIAFAFFLQFIPCFLVVKMIQDSRHMKLSWPLYLSLQAGAMALSSVLLLKTDLGFTLSLMPVIVSTSVPFLVVSYHVLVSHRKEANWIEKGMGYLVLSAVVNNFNYAFFRLDESAAWWGWSVSIAQYQAFSIFLPLLINHRRERKERKNLELALEKLSGPILVPHAVKTEELYRTLEFQIEQKEEFSRRLEMSNRHLAEEQEMNEILVKTISHDLANPLTVVSAYLDMIDTGRIAEQDRAKISDRIKHNLQSALDMISRVRTTVVTRNQANFLRPGPVDLDLAIQRVLLVFEERMKKKNITPRIINNVSSTYVLADENALVENVLSNIISNAIKYSFDNSEIHLIISDRENQLRLEIRDFGVGINPYRGDKNRYVSTPGTKGEGGTGFGLIIMSYFMRKFEGTYEIIPQSLNGERGTSFVLNFKKTYTIDQAPHSMDANIFS